MNHLNDLTFDLFLFSLLSFIDIICLVALLIN